MADSKNSIGTIRVAIVDDHQMFIDGMSMLFDTFPNLEVVSCSNSGDEFLKQVKKKKPDVALIDINMPGKDGIRLTYELCERYPTCQVIILSMHNEFGYIQRALSAGAKGYVLKEAGGEEIAKAITEVYMGNTYYSGSVTQTVMEGLSPKKQPIELTRKEIEVLHHIAEGYSTKEIADAESISESTIQSHRRSLLIKFGVKNSAALIREAIKLKFVSDD